MKDFRGCVGCVNFGRSPSQNCFPLWDIIQDEVDGAEIVQNDDGMMKCNHPEGTLVVMKEREEK